MTRAMTAPIGPPCSDRLVAVAVVAILAIAVTPTAVRADPKAEAQVMFDQGLTLFKAGKFAEACAAFESSVEKFPSLGNRGKLAECYERVDKLAKAWALYREVADAAKRDNDTRREKAARKRAEELLIRVPKITIVVPPESRREGLTITRDGMPVSVAELGLPMNVDAGPHTITASAPGQAAWSVEVDAVDGGSTEVKVPILESMLEAPVTDKPGATAGTSPSPPVESPIIEPGSKRAKELAQTLVTEGAGLLESKQYQLALDRFIAAYELFPSPKLLLNMASTLREMGRLADAADMYQAFIEAPDTNPEFVGEAKAILNSLDEQLYLLMVRITPRGSDVSLDGGPWISVGDKRLMVRLTPGIHMVRSRKPGFALEELTINAFEGEKNDLEMKLEPPAVPDPSAPVNPIIADTGLGDDQRDPVDPSAGKAIDAGGSSKDGQSVIPILSTGARAERGGVNYVSTAVLRDRNDEIVEVLAPRPDAPDSELGVTAQLRIDGAGGGAAAAFGISFSPGTFLRLELDLTGMISKPVPPSGIEMEAKRIYGVFLGARYRILTGRIRPVVGVGVPMFFSDGKPRIGGRASGGLELVINGHLAIVGELGYEHFFNSQEGYKANVFVPLVQVTGRL
jgi:tetratricopeptide (TPR) repeat protein